MPKKASLKKNRSTKKIQFGEMNAGNTTTQPNNNNMMTQPNNNMMTQPNNMMNDVYDSASEFGIFMALIGLIFAIFSGVIMIIIALYLIINKGTHSSEIDAEVVDSKCNTYKDSKNNTYKQCDTTIKYTVANTSYSNTISTQQIYANGSKVNVVYDPSNPNNSLFKSGWRKRFAYILLAIAVFIIVAAGIRYYIVKNFKIAAAASGFGEGAALISAPFQSSSSNFFTESNNSPMPDEMLTFVPEVSSSSE
jgi:hypothetical protein